MQEILHISCLHKLLQNQFLTLSIVIFLWAKQIRYIHWCICTLICVFDAFKTVLLSDILYVFLTSFYNVSLYQIINKQLSIIHLFLWCLFLITHSTGKTQKFKLTQCYTSVFGHIGGIRWPIFTTFQFRSCQICHRYVYVFIIFIFMHIAIPVHTWMQCMQIDWYEFKYYGPWQSYCLLFFLVVLINVQRS